MKRRILKLILLFLLAILPLGVFAAVTQTRPDPYQNTYLAAFHEKYQTLYETKGKKIVLIGGSGLPFGLRTDLLANELEGDYQVVNYGLYATLGTKFMMDTARDAISAGDVVILCPELSTQTFSLYFNGEAVLQATNGISPMLTGLPIGNMLSLFYHYFGYGIDKIGYAIDGEILDPNGIYRKDSINEWGDIAVERENNIMNNGYDVNMPIVTDDSLLDDDFLDYVNDFVKDCKEKNASVYFGFAPANIAAVSSSKNARSAFEARLAEALDCPLLGSIEDYLLDEGYFYDTNFHLNSAGALRFSAKLACLLKERLGMEPTSSIEYPEPPPLASDIVVDLPQTEDPVSFDKYLGEPNNDYIDYFEYMLEGNSYTIVGVKSEHLDVKEVILPSVYNGKNITALAENALEGCTNLERIHIGTTYKSLEAGAFRGCIALEKIFLYEKDGNRIAPPLQGLLDGASRSVKICIPEDGNYVTGYVWSNYEDKFQTFHKEETP